MFGQTNIGARLMAYPNNLDMGFFSSLSNFSANIPWSGGGGGCCFLLKLEYYSSENLPSSIFDNKALTSPAWLMS